MYVRLTLIQVLQVHIEKQKLYLQLSCNIKFVASFFLNRVNKVDMI